MRNPDVQVPEWVRVTSDPQDLEVQLAACTRFNDFNNVLWAWLEWDHDPDDPLWTAARPGFDDALRLATTFYQAHQLFLWAIPEREEFMIAFRALMERVQTDADLHEMFDHYRFRDSAFFPRFGMAVLANEETVRLLRDTTQRIRPQQSDPEGEIQVRQARFHFLV